MRLRLRPKPKKPLSRSMRVRLVRAFARDQREGLMFSALVRIIALIPIIAWLAIDSSLTGLAYVWQIGAAGIFVVTSLAHYAAARWASAHGRLTLSYALIALDVVLLGILLGVRNPFIDPIIPYARQFQLVAFYWFFLFILHAAFTTSWRFVLWTGAWIVAVRIAQTLWVMAQPGTFTEFSIDPQTPEAWQSAFSSLDFLLLFSVVGDIIAAISFTLVAAFLVGRSRQRVLQQALTERMRGQIARYVPPTVVDHIIDQDAGFTAPRRVDAAVLFVDVVGSTRLAESLGPNGTIRLLRRLHRRLSSAVFRHDGVIDKFLGDGLMATFGTTGDDQPYAANALAAALEMLSSISTWSEERVTSGAEPVEIGIGLDLGPVVAGDVGDDRRLEFTVIGDPVNVASRAERLTRTLDASLLATSRFVDAVRRDTSHPDAASLAGRLTSMGTHTIPGRAEPVGLWGVTKGGKAISAPGSDEAEATVVQFPETELR